MTEITIPAIAADGSLFPIEKMRAHRLGQLHLALSVFVFSPDGSLLIQRRAEGKYHCAGQWANTCCSHPHWGEPLADAAARRTLEELGFCLPLAPIGMVDYRADVGGGLIEHERVHLFRGTAAPDRLALRPDPAEVSETAWVTMPALRESMNADPASFTPWFRIYVDRWLDLWAPAA